MGEFIKISRDFIGDGQPIPEGVVLYTFDDEFAYGYKLEPFEIVQLGEYFREVKIKDTKTVRENIEKQLNERP